LADSGAKRDASVVALGGGVVGDLAGYAAASYMRGIALVQVPTSLLAQVDSSVGGKVGIDIPEGKNLVGAFHPPVAVQIATELLGTLPLREFNNGSAEIWKTAAILDEDLFCRLEARGIVANSEDLDEIVAKCVRWKAMIVAADEYETTGLRAILNFGHTVGHAIEQVLHYNGILHGEAVAIGMVKEALVGEMLGITPKGCAERLRTALSKHGLPTEMPAGIPVDNLISAMAKDKKGVGQTRDLAFSLLEGIGKCKLYTTIPRDSVREALVCS
jgi:3-dehydroquinate synthase